MKRKRPLAALLVFAVVFLSACGMAKPGRVKDARIVNAESQIYSDKEIAAAIRVAERYFRKHFTNCELTEIGYAGDDKTADFADTAARYGDDRVIVLISTFTTGENAGQGGLNENYEYTGWNWILTAKAGGQWAHRDHGY